MNHLARLAVSVATVALFAEPTIARAADAAPAGGLEEIVVTAQKRTENAQKAPLAVTSLSATALADAHVTGAVDLSRVVPDVRVEAGGGAGDPGGGSALFSIRGLGSSASGPQGSAGVAAHFDGVYRQNGISNSEFFDLERIEVDSGPQGTLYGRSAAAGAVNIIPNKPTHKFEGEATLELGNYSAIRGEGMINVPLTDDLAVRAAFQTQNHDGYYTDGYDDLDAKSGRLQALYTPNDDLSIRLYGDYTHLGGRGNGNVFVAGAAYPSLVALLPQAANTDLRTASIDEYCFAGSKLVNTCVQSVDITKWAAHADISYNFGWGILDLLPAYNEQDETNRNSNAPLPLSNYTQAYDQRQMNFEARLNDPGTSDIKWVGGLNIYHNEADPQITSFINVLTALGPATPGVASIVALNDQQSQEDSYAAFGQVTYPVLDWLRATAGARYNYDSSSYSGSLATNSQLVYVIGGPLIASPIPASSPISTGPLATAVRFRALTYRFALDADLTPTSLVYGSIGSGYKPGGLGDGGPASSNTAGQLGILSSAPPVGVGLPVSTLQTLEPSQSFGPEKVTHYEIGSKNRFFDNKLQINDALYYDDYSNYQNGNTQVANPLLFRSQGFIVTNAGQSKVYGNELSIRYRITPSDLIDFSVNYLHAVFTSYKAPAFLSPSGIVPGVDYKGYRLPNAPLASGNIGYQHFIDFADGSQVTASVFTQLSGSYWVYFAEAPGTHQGAYTRTTLDLTWSSPTGKFSVTGFINNAEDRTIKTFGIATAGFSQVALDAPRTFGFSVTGRF